MDKNKLNNNIEENVEGISDSNIEKENDSIDLGDKSEESKKDGFNKKKLIVPAVILFGLGLGSIAVKKHFDYANIGGEVVSLENLKPLSKETINVKKYMKEDYPVIYDSVGEYGGGAMCLKDGKYLTYGYSSDNKGIVVKLYKEDDSLMFETEIKSNKSDYTIDGLDNVFVTSDNNILLNTWYSNYSQEEEDTFSVVTKFNLEGEILSELTLEGRASVWGIDNSDNFIIVENNGNNDFSCKKIVKFDKENNKIFEYKIYDIKDKKEEHLYRLFVDGDKTILITNVYEDKSYTNRKTVYRVLNKEGKEIIKKEISKDNDIFNEMRTITRTSDGGFIIERAEEVGPYNDYVYGLKSITKVDSELNEIWTRKIDKIVQDFEIVEIDNDYVMLTKDVYKIDDIKKQSKITSITKIDSSGKDVWNKYLDYDSNKEFNIANSGEIDLDKSLYVSGENVILEGTVFENNESKGYVKLIIDKNGNIIQ